jgi:hypothetical protein
LKRKVPRTAKMKYMSIRREKTLKRDGSENVIVYINACKPLYLFISLNSLETLSTLITLAS